MVIGIFGESCVGKTTLAEKVSKAMNARIYTGKDYLRLAKNENMAKKMFETLLQEAVIGDSIIYVISEKEYLELLPEGGYPHSCNGRSGTYQRQICCSDTW